MLEEDKLQTMSASGATRTYSLDQLVQYCPKDYSTLAVLFTTDGLRIRLYKCPRCGLVK